MADVDVTDDHARDKVTAKRERARRWIAKKRASWSPEERAEYNKRQAKAAQEDRKTDERRKARLLATRKWLDSLTPERRNDLKEYKAAHYKTNRDTIITKRKTRLLEEREYSRIYREKNRQRVNEFHRLYMASYRKQNSERTRAWENNRRARQKASGGVFTGDDIKDIFLAQKGRCAVCRISIKKRYDIDHIVPIALGGSNDRRNLQLLCHPCNCKKSKQHPSDFMRRQGFLL